MTSARPITMLEVLRGLIQRRLYEKELKFIFESNCLTCFAIVMRFRTPKEGEAAASKWKQPEGNWKHNLNYLSEKSI